MLVWIEDEIGHNMPLIQSPVQRKSLILFNSVNAERGEEAQKESLKLAEVGSWGLRKEADSITSECKVKQHVLMEKLQRVIQRIWLR